MIDKARKDQFMDIDRMVNEGLGGGRVTRENGLIQASTTDTMEHTEFVLSNRKEEQREVSYMNSERAKQILNSSETIEVHYNGESIWIEDVDQENNKVHIQIGGNPENRITVASNELSEV